MHELYQTFCVAQGFLYSDSSMTPQPSECWMDYRLLVQAIPFG